MTPWFAMAVGLVVSASLSLFVPRASLSFPRATPQVCATSQCVRRHSLTAPSPGAALKHDSKLPSSRPSTSAHATPVPVPTRAPVVTLHYGLLPQTSWSPGSGSGFQAFIVVTATSKLTDWKLRFRLPSGYVDQIYGAATWRQVDGDEVVVRWQPMPLARSDLDQARLVVVGSGSPGWPTDCVFDGLVCTFKPLTKYEFGGASPAPQPSRSGSRDHRAHGG